MDTSDCEKKKVKDKQSVDFDIVRKDEVFWQKAVKILSKNEISEAKIEYAENDNNEVAKHREKVFDVYCKCNHCRVSRELIVATFVENCAYNQLWSKLQEIIRSYYNFLPATHESTMNRKYQEIINKSCGIRWSSDGSIDVKKNIHVSMGSYFSISNEMTFMIVFNMLYARDRHQLFELLCLELTSIILSYRESIKEITRCANNDSEEYFKPDEFLDYIINGYERILEIAETQTPLVIEMREHLQKFSLTWKLMNQCMYYRFLYVDVESCMADCILRLKDAVPLDTYKNHVYRFIKFDEEMTAIGQVWEVALVALELFRKSTPEQVNRVERINMIRQIHQSLRDLKNIPIDAGKPLSDQVLALDWIVSSVKDEVWLSVINSIRREPLFKNIRKDCKCWACLISDGNSVPDICAIPLDDDSKKTAVLKKKKINEECYHLAWAVFKHLKNRKPYNKQFFHPEIFCVFNDPPCEQMECLVAQNLIVGAYPLSFTKFLLSTYEPLAAADREKFLKVPSQSLIRKFCKKKGGAAAKEILHEAEEINHTFLLLNMFWDDDDIADPLLRTGLAAALAENFKIEVTFPQKHTIFSYFYGLFRLDPKTNDIILDLAWLEQINLANLFKNFPSNLHDSVVHPLNLPNSLEQPIEMHLNEVKITAEVSAGGSALDLVQYSMKEVADKLNSITLTDGNENTKAVIENEIKKPLVEALKLAASNKKLEAELKSLQKEHNMLKDMVKGLEQIHGEKKEVQVTVTTTTTKSSETQASNTSSVNNVHSKCGHGHNHSHSHSHPQSGSSSPSITTSEDHGKDDCVCYYCTLFGKNQDLTANPRSTEARDRLRKKLHHLQNQKDFSSKSKNNLKNISLLLKNGTQSSPKSNASTTLQKCETTGNTKTKSNGPMSSMTGSMKMKVELEVQHNKKKTTTTTTTIIKPTYCSKPDENVKIQRPTEINLKSLENLIEYIEGPSSKAVAEQKKLEELAAKKQLKKAKQQQQKVRRQIEQLLSELRVTNSFLHEIGILIKQVQNQISQLKSNKSRNKESRRVVAAEEKFTELLNRRMKIENQVRSIVDDIKELNPDINIIEECLDMKAVMNIIAPDYVPPVETKPIPPPQPTNILVQRPVPIRATNASASQNIPQQKPQQSVPQKNLPTLIQAQPKSTEEDPAKRMVTIRRVNLPHAEPQVTVTAKGTTPDMDQLLYTFVNGQLVPASNLPPTAFQNANGPIQLYMSNNNGQTKTIVDHRNLQQIQAQQLLQQQQQNSQQKSTKQGKKDGNKKEAQIQESSHVESNKINNKKSTQQVEKSQKDSKKESKKNENNSKKKDNTSAATKKESKDSKDMKKNSKHEINKSQSEEPPTPAKKKVKKTSYIDPEFAANPFKLLDDNDDEEEFTSETDDDAEVITKEEKEVLPDIASLSIKENDEVNSNSNVKQKEIKIATTTTQKKAQQQTLLQQNIKIDKNSQKKQTVTQQVINQKSKMMDRQDSINSAASSNNSKDVKQNKKQKNSKNLNDSMTSKTQSASNVQSYVQSFPLHPQYQPTVYQPADYMRKPTITSQPSHHHHHQQQQQQFANSNSIMEQLNRGVQVEGLQLPPGITLTKVAPSNDVASRRDSINRIVQPMQDYSRMSMDEHMMFSQGRDPNGGIIMVESNPHATQNLQQQQQQPENSNSKKNKKKKKSKGDGNDVSNKLNQHSNGSHIGGSVLSNSGDRMVTLKNPNHHNNSETMMTSMMRNLQTPPSFISPMMESPQQAASIIKNENGMYTIRNPAFQNVFGSSPSSISNMQPSSVASAVNSSNASGYGNGMVNNSSPYITHSTIVDSSNRPPYMPNSFSCEHELMQQQQQQQQQPKCNSVIGSEMRNLIQRRKEQEYSAHMDPYGLRQQSQYSHFGGSGVNFSPSSASCDENFMPRSSSYQSYSSPSINYDDLRLQPGKMLNSEVTIHNVTESKFFQNQAKSQAPIAPIGTPRNTTTSSSSSVSLDTAPKIFGGSDLLVQPAVSSVSSIVNRPNASTSTEFNGSESGIYQGRNSIDIENEERDIEMFKQFDMNYLPPKQKMKCNINMSDILVNPKKSTVTHIMTDEFDKRQTSSTNSNSPSSLASSSLDELYEKTPSYYATHHNLTDEKSSAASSLGFSSSNGM